MDSEDEGQATSGRKGQNTNYTMDLIFLFHLLSQLLKSGEVLSDITFLELQF